MLGLIACIYFACKSDGKRERTDKSRIREEVTHTLHRYHDAIRQNGLTAEFEFLDSSEDFFWIPPGFEQSLSYDSVSAILQLNANGFISISNHWDELNVVPLSEDYASYAGKLSSVSTDTSGHRATIRLIESGIMVRRNTGWKLLCGQTALIHLQHN